MTRHTQKKGTEMRHIPSETSQGPSHIAYIHNIQHNAQTQAGMVCRRDILAKRVRGSRSLRIIVRVGQVEVQFWRHFITKRMCNKDENIWIESFKSKKVCAFSSRARDNLS